MDIRDLDRLVSNTELNPFVKLALRRVRKSIEQGQVTKFTVNKHSWSVRIADPKGLECLWTFTLKDSKVDDGEKK